MESYKYEYRLFKYECAVYCVAMHTIVRNTHRIADGFTNGCTDWRTDWFADGGTYFCTDITISTKDTNKITNQCANAVSFDYVPVHYYMVSTGIQRDDRIASFRRRLLRFHCRLG